MLFTKRILPPGKFRATSPDGKRVDVEITKEKIKGWVERFKAMDNAQLQIPAPWRHDPKAIPLSAEASKGSQNNAGFWKDFWQDDDGGLSGKVDIPLSADAEKVGSTVTEVSPLIVPDWEDGSGHLWRDDSILHVALVTHPIVAGQENFVPVKSSSPTKPPYAVAMSHLLQSYAFSAADDVTHGGTSSTGTSVPVNASQASIADVLKALASMGMKLPDDTVAENLAERIITAAHAIAGKNGEEGDGDEEGGKDPKKEQPTPIVMSQTPGVSNMAAKTAEQLTQELEASKNEQAQALAFASGQVKKAYEVRIGNLVDTGRLAPAIRDKKLNPLVEGFQLSLDKEGKPVHNQLDDILEILEGQPGKPLRTPIPSRRTRGVKLANEEAYPFQEGEGADDMTDEQADAMADSILESAGISTK